MGSYDTIGSRWQGGKEREKVKLAQWEKEKKRNKPRENESDQNRICRIENEKKSKERSRVNKNVDVWQLTSFSFAREHSQWETDGHSDRHTQHFTYMIVVIMIRGERGGAGAFVAVSSGDDRDADATMQTHIVCGLEFRVMDSGQRART